MGRHQIVTTADDQIPEPCQIYLVVEAGPGARERLEAALAVARIASVLIMPRPGQGLSAGEVKPLVEIAQSGEAAAIIHDDAKLARVLKADGVHLPARADALDAYHEARSIVGAGLIVGADCGGSRHIAMELGEAGADYIGIARPPADDEDYETREDFIAWWAEIFEVPCVAFDISGVEEASRAVDAGADFVALMLPRGASIGESTELVRAVGRLVGSA